MDAIDREALLRKRIIVPIAPILGCEDVHYEDVVFVKDIKDAEPVLPKGHWIAIEDEEGNIVGHYCSKCDLPLETDDKTMYCPHCGCRMSEVWE